MKPMKIRIKKVENRLRTIICGPASGQSTKDVLNIIGRDSNGNDDYAESLGRKFKGLVSDDVIRTINRKVGDDIMLQVRPVKDEIRIRIKEIVRPIAEPVT